MKRTTKTPARPDIVSLTEKWDAVATYHWNGHSSPMRLINDGLRLLQKIEWLTKKVPVSAEVEQGLDVIVVQTDKLMTIVREASPNNPDLSDELVEAVDTQFKELNAAYDLLEDKVAQKVINDLKVGTEFLREKYSPEALAGTSH